MDQVGASLPSATAKSIAGGITGDQEVECEPLKHLTQERTRENPKQQWSQKNMGNSGFLLESTQFERNHTTYV